MVRPSPTRGFARRRELPAGERFARNGERFFERASMSSDTTHRDDALLVAAVRQGDGAARAAFTARMECVSTMLGSLNRRYGRPLSDVDLHDLAQETLLKVWQKLDTFSGASRLETWVFQFCFLELRNAMRRGRRRAERERPLVDAAEAPVVALTELPFDVEKVLSLLDRLAEEDAALIRLRHFEGLDFEAIGRRCGRPTNTVKTRYHRALLKLRYWLQVAPPADVPREESS